MHSIREIQLTVPAVSSAVEGSPAHGAVYFASDDIGSPNPVEWDDAGLG
jgi:hypothetical protein